MSKINVEYSVTRDLTVDDLLFMSNVFHMYSHVIRSPVNIDPSGQYWHDATNRHLKVLAQFWQTVPAL